MGGGEGEKKKMLVLRGNDDDQEFEMPEETAAAASRVLRNMVEDGCAEPFVRVENVAGRILGRVVEYCNRHYAGGEDLAEGDDGALERFDAEFIGGADDDTLFDLIFAANYLDVRRLLDLGCRRIADEMKGKTVEQIRARFHIVNDYTEEEEAEVRKENSWAFDLE